MKFQKILPILIFIISLLASRFSLFPRSRFFLSILFLSIIYHLSSIISPIHAVKSFDLASNFSPAGIFTDFGALATFIVKFLTTIVGALSLIFIVISGIKIVTSSGDSKKLGSATSTLIYAIVGLVVAILAFVIINLVQRFIGSSIPIS